jgi:hypothetical protein
MAMKLEDSEVPRVATLERFAGDAQHKGRILLKSRSLSNVALRLPITMLAFTWSTNTEDEISHGACRRVNIPLVRSVRSS